MDFEAKRLFESSDMKESFESLNIDIDSQNEDDATLIVVRREDYSENCEQALPDYLEQINIIKQLDKYFVEGNKIGVFDMLSRIIALNIKLSKQDFTHIMEVWGKSAFYHNGDTEINAELFKLRKKL